MDRYIDTYLEFTTRHEKRQRNIECDVPHLNQSVPIQARDPLYYVIIFKVK